MKYAKEKGDKLIYSIMGTRKGRVETIQRTVTKFVW
jgi:hypothetical protein